MKRRKSLKIVSYQVAFIVRKASALFERTSTTRTRRNEVNVERGDGQNSQIYTNYDQTLNYKKRNVKTT